MVREAQAPAEEDRRRRELVEARNHADAAIYSVEKTLKDAEGRVPAHINSEVEQAISAVKEAMKGEDVLRIKQATERLSQVAVRIGEAMSRAAPQGDQGVVDAEFEEVDKRDRKAG
jgi:molecular chaperone DnaK